MKIPACIGLDLNAADLGQQIAALPAASGVYLLRPAGNSPHLHLGWSANLPRRLTRLLLSSNTGQDSPVGRLRGDVARVECWGTGSKLENSLLMYELAKLYFPGQYVKRLRLRIPYFVGLTSGDPFPRVLVTNRVLRKDGAFFGPFPNRDSAQRYEQEVAGLFQIRKCVERLAPEPGHPGCMYGEMNQCLRPCQCAVTEEEYATEIERVTDFLITNGRSAISVLSAARERACDETDFEEAAHIHKRIERVNAAVSARDEVIRQVQQFNGVALTRAVQSRQFRLWPMLEGLWQDPITLDFATEEAETKSLDQELRERLGQSLIKLNTEGKRDEHLAIFSRWYFSSWRDGHWYSFRNVADLNYRRLVREMSKMSKSVLGDSV